jgi:hypothetical protein
MTMPVRIDCDSHFMPKDVFEDVDPRFEHRRPRVWFNAAGHGGITYPEREAKLSHHQRYILPNSFQFNGQRPGDWEPDIRIGFPETILSTTMWSWTWPQAFASLITTPSPECSKNTLAASLALPISRCSLLQEH